MKTLISATAKKEYQTPQVSIVALSARSEMLTVSGSGAYDISYGGDGDGEEGD